MAKLSSINKNNRRIKLANKFYEKRIKLKKIIMDKKLPLEERFRAQQKLSKLPRNSAKVRVRNRCCKSCLKCISTDLRSFRRNRKTCTWASSTDFRVLWFGLRDRKFCNSGSQRICTFSKGCCRCLSLLWWALWRGFLSGRTPLDIF